MRPARSFIAIVVVLAFVCVASTAGCKIQGSGATSTAGPPVAQPPRLESCPANPADVPATRLQLPPEPLSGDLYVALGDSYSSGEGAPFRTVCGESIFLDGTEQGREGCHRSWEAWPARVWRAEKMRFGLRFAACSGSVINDFYQGPNHQYPNDAAPQRDALLNAGRPDPRVKLVTLTFGGNDATFATIITYCANVLKKRRGSCLAGQGAAERLIAYLGRDRGAWPGRHTLADLYADVHAAAPDARVLVVGYPRFFPASPPTGCGTGGGTNFTEMEMLGLNQTVDLANRTIKQRAFDAGFEYVDITHAMKDHDVCSKENWINRGIPSWTNLSFHPTVAGQQAIADKVIACIRNSCAKPETGLPADMQFLVGEWGGRYRSITVNPDGTGTMKLLNPPADPAKPAADGDTTILDIQLEPGLTAHIIKSNDLAVPAGGRITIKRTDDPGVLEITTPDRTWGTATYCNPKTAADPLACG
ncbi:SGNH/GDSL hydrolase family protein [Actinoplanes couchii]|uniref:SGNH hydrolase-type esterase domain-containing protein n=1 Tax=Actinoplanes couchii TaxID=403638 RepID=A0ABQ3XF01_9ACTN|nr:SGNH/GDSL hydrolase family protein [Actinoplanes couchii]MDR6319866.1 lysophospholipase L1-like esterase [Actinoplanes couchii]GID57000.1 hypothetical protein Aco03nite_054040 [Actinoplanes couchii]